MQRACRADEQLSVGRHDGSAARGLAHGHCGKHLELLAGIDHDHETGFTDRVDPAGDRDGR